MKSETKWAVIATVALLVTLLLSKMLGLHSAEKFETGMIVGTIVSALTFIVIYYLVCKEKRDGEYNGIMSWQEGFWTCARMTLIYIPLSCAVLYFYLTTINAEFCTVFLQKAADMGGASGKDPINDNLYFQAKMSYLMGGLFSLIFPAITKRAA